MRHRTAAYQERKRALVRAYLRGNTHMVPVWPELARKPWRTEA